MNQLKRLKQKKAEIIRVVQRRGRWPSPELINQYGDICREISGIELAQALVDELPPPLPQSWDRKAFVRVMSKYTNRGVFDD